MSANDFGSEGRIHHRTIEPDEEIAPTDIVEHVADIEGCAVEELPSFWMRVGNVVQDVFSEPPGPEAQVTIQFTYAGYRIGLDQRGGLELMKVEETIATER